MMRYYNTRMLSWKQGSGSKETQVVSIVSEDQNPCLIRTSEYMQNSEDQQAVLIKGFLP